MKRNLNILFSLAVLASLVLAACGGQPATAQSPGFRSHRGACQPDRSAACDGA
jgi:hypothetical protein